MPDETDNKKEEEAQSSEPENTNQDDESIPDPNSEIPPDSDPIRKSFGDIKTKDHLTFTEEKDE